MQVFESGGELAVNPGLQTRALVIAFAFGVTTAALPTLVGLYLLVIA